MPRPGSRVATIPIVAIGWVLVACLLGACGGPTEPPLAPLPERFTRATLSGPLCEDQYCKCRELAPDPGSAPQGDRKRYEIRIGPVANELWVTLDDMVLYKDVEVALRCYYVDLRPGRHSVTLRGQGEPGFAARLAISEQGAKGWYDTFDFNCGSGSGFCDLEQLQTWQASLAKYRRNVHDPCGSTKIRDINWRSGRSLDRLHPTNLQLDLVLDVYTFVPKHGPGDPACANAF